MPIIIVPSFPSGHAATNVVYYGFLLYVSFTKPVSQWRYRWILIPFQVHAALNILLIGFSRVLEGSHWLTDALGGYLFGALFLVLLIVLYRWTLDKLTKRPDKRLLEKSCTTPASLTYIGFGLIGYALWTEKGEAEALRQPVLAS